MAIPKRITFEGVTYDLGQTERAAAHIAVRDTDTVIPEVDLHYPNGITAITDVTTAMVAGYIHTIVDVNGGANVIPTLTRGQRIKAFMKAGQTSNTTTFTTTSGQTYHTNSWALIQDIVDGSNLTVQATTATASDNTITLNGSTKGGQGGDELTFIGISSTLVYCELRLNGTGTLATPFSNV